MNSANELQIAIFQLPVGHDVHTNVENAVKAITKTKAQNPKIKLAILPESFNAPYGVEYFAKYAEPVPQGFTCQALSALAKKLGIYIIGGSLIESVKPDKLYNTCTVWSPQGEMIGRHRKIHLFTMDIELKHNGGVRFDESCVLSAGNEITIVEIEGHKVGIGICHDKRFDELARIYRNEGCEMLVYPSAFCICQGPMHWELLQRARASDNQVYVVTCSPARDNMSGYVAYGHSMVVDPWGNIKHEATSGPEILLATLDFQVNKDVERQIPLYSQRRRDVYETIYKKAPISPQRANK